MTALELLKELSLEEKASLCSGSDFWHLTGIKRLDLPEIMVTDGPHGLRKQSGESDHVGINKSVPSTCFPTASATASSWDRKLMFDIGSALGEECLQEKVSVLLGPGANIKRSPLCGRNFEYISEDPLLTGEMATAIIQGVQNKGIGTSLKHFAVNNQEYRRMVTDSVVDERTLREIYLPGFEMAIKKAQPWTVMCAYNKIEGVYCSENKKLLTDILKEEWGHKGLVVTDWGACNDRVAGIKAGLELEMPSSGGINNKKIVDAVKSGGLKEAALDAVVIKVLELILNSKKTLQDYTYDHKKHHDLARKAAVESAVLLKNNKILPLNKNCKITFIGEFFELPRYQGSGSSLINPSHLVSAKEALENKGLTFDYCRGYDKSIDHIDEKLISEAVTSAKGSEVVVIFAGLTDAYESEGFDRTHLDLPLAHTKLIERVLEVNQQVVVVLQNGAPVTMPWRNHVAGIITCYLGGQAGGQAIIELLFGDENPSGKLAETYPEKLSDCGSTPFFGMGPHAVEYREGLYVGYRYFDTFEVEPMFPFGYGLSYTTFEYNNIKSNHNEMTENDTLQITFDLKNTGDVEGAEIVQVYVHDVESRIHRPEKELKAFEKVLLKPGETKTITLSLDKRAFAFYDVHHKMWCVESGDFDILIARSSKDIVLSKTIKVTSTTTFDHLQEKDREFTNQRHPITLSDDRFEALIQRELPSNEPTRKGSYTRNSTLGDVKHTKVGKKVYQQVYEGFRAMIGDGNDEAMTSFAEAIIDEMPLRNLVAMGGGELSSNKLNALLDLMNGHTIKGLAKMIFNS